MKNGHALPIMTNLFVFQENTHNIRDFQIISNENKKTINYGLDAVSYRISVPWQIYRMNKNLQVLSVNLNKK